MITIRRSTDAGLEVVDRPVKGCWINMVDPNAQETQQVAQDLNVDPQWLKFSLDPEAIPRAEKVDGGLRILVRIPHRQRADATVPYITLPLGILVTERGVVTLCRQEHDLLRDLGGDDLQQADLSTGKPYRFVLHLLWSIANSYLRHLSEINQAVDRLEDRLQGALQNREVLALLRFQKSLVYFTTALETNELMLERLQRAEMMALKPPDADLLDDVITENQEAMKMAQIASDILSQTMDAFASIISNNLNVVMKFLASITVVLIVPQIIGTFYGMNIDLPIQEQPFAFFVTVGLSVVLAVVIGFVFWKRNWL